MLAFHHKSFKPIYYQISESISDLIESGQLPPNSLLPSERELMQSHRISRNTARQSLDLLVKMGLAYRVQGRGTFVAPPPMRYGLHKLTGFTEEMIQRGWKPGSRLLNMEVISPLPKVAQRLNLPSNQRVVKIERLRLADDKPMALATSIVPEHLCPGLASEHFDQESLYALLEGKYGLRIWRAEQTLRPTIATQYEAELLSIEPGMALLLVEGVAFLQDDTPIEYMKLLYRGDRYEFTINALRYPEQVPVSPERAR
jgi:GntR family transcriptional regulator